MTSKAGHHTVPRFLLRQFAVDGHVVEVRRDGRQHRTPISSATVQSHFYSFEDRAGRRVSELEVYLDEEVESPAAPALKRLVAGEVNEADLALAGRFLAFQLVRSPRFRSIDSALAKSLGPILAGVDGVSEHVSSSGSSFEATMARRIFDDGRARASGAYVSEPGRETFIRLLVRTADRLLCEFGALKWAVAVADKPVFITSDSPAVVFNPTLPVGGFAGFKVREDNEFRLPISPRHLLVGSMHRLGGTVLPATEELAVTTNQLLARECDKAILYMPGSVPAGDPRLSPVAPALPEPSITLNEGEPGHQTVVSYPAISDARLRRIVEDAGG